MKIGNLNIDHPVFLAPMAGVTDHSFRVISRSLGAGVVYSEFVSSEGIIRENIKTLNMMNFTENERPIGIQIFGHQPDVVGTSAKMIREIFNPDIIDINFGCPVPKVVKRCAGAGALKDLGLMEDIVRSVIENAAGTPVTVKMRAGADKTSIVSTQAGELLEKCGVSAITLHPRTMKQLYTGSADWNLIRELKESIGIPVIGNGDIQNADDALRMFDETGCDGIMIARAALGNPWIFRSVSRALKGEPAIPVTLEDKIEMCYTHYTLLKADRHPTICFNLTKKQVSWYLKGFSGAAEWRKRFMVSQSIEEIETRFEEIFTAYQIPFEALTASVVHT
ncbi:MAG: tRNA dihydrouridine synthase DusB [Candidatus Marinimicrobia bacterium]|nr:tRNA dihydrouridine synthase DusB [Candidatus Neomarinimicrobiota bacterium]